MKALVRGLIFGMAALIATPAAALEGAGTIPGSFGFIPIIIDDFDQSTNQGLLFTVIKLANVSSSTVTLHWFFADAEWTIRDICYHLTGNDFDWFEGLGYTHFIDTSQGGFAWFFVTNYVGNGKVGDPNGAPCGTFQLQYDAIVASIFYIDVVNNVTIGLDAPTLEANFQGAIPDDGVYTFGPAGSLAEYRAIFPATWYASFFPQSIVTTQLAYLLVPNPLFNEQVPQFPFEVLTVRSWNDLEEPLPSVQPLTFLCWGMPTVTDISQLDLNLFAPDGGWLRLDKLFGGDVFLPVPEPEVLLVQVDTVGGPFARAGHDWAGAFYVHHNRTITETVFP
jgi:hypothetical protein